MVYDIKAYLALVLFVPIAFVVFASARRPLVAILGVYLGGLLFLPEHAAFDFPMLPPMDKNGFAAVGALVGTVMLQRSRLRAVRPLQGVELFFLVIVVGNIGTAMTNPDTLAFGRDIVRNHVMVAERRVLSSIQPYDVVSMTVRDLLGILLPFYLGRVLFRSREDAHVLLKGLVVFGLVYIPLMVFEMRMSPQLHNWVYGYMANKFLHSVRGGGFKPTVFLNNGLAVAMFILAALISAAVMTRARIEVLSIPAAIPLGLLWIVLLLSRNLGAALYSVVAVPIVLVSRGKLAGRVALVLFGLVIAYPTLRATGVFPAYELVDAIAEVSPDRAQSINTRFVNEDQLFERARERLWFGWGGFGRNRIYNEYGRDVSITDGEWIIRMGMRGVIGFIGSFGMLLAPILVVRRRIRKVRLPADRRILDALALLVALNAVDLLPNGMFTQLPLFIAGAATGLATGMARRRPSEQALGLATGRGAGQ